MHNQRNQSEDICNNLTHQATSKCIFIRSVYLPAVITRQFYRRIMFYQIKFLKRLTLKLRFLSEIIEAMFLKQFFVEVSLSL